MIALSDIDGWLDYIQSQHVREIDMSLSRVRQVYKRLLPDGLSCKIISIAGTNGKGSTAELISSIYHHAGYRVGKFTSPHLLAFNERFEVSRKSVADDIVLKLLPRIEASTDDITLTYFEYCTLLAILIFDENKVDVAVMEVGLGGRLDSVNVLDADVSIITNISIDHTDWLGNTIDEISLEKAGIARPEKPCVIGMSQPPQTMLDFLSQRNVPVWQRSIDFDTEVKGDDSWGWQNQSEQFDNLPLPFQQHNEQIDNAATAIQAVRLLKNDLPISFSQIKSGIAEATLAGRCQIVQTSPLIIIDVSHNEASVARLASFVRQQQFAGKCYAVCGMLQDKKIEQSLNQISPLIDSWSVASINNGRGANAKQLFKVLQQLPTIAKNTPIAMNDSVTGAYDKVRSLLSEHDCLVVFGSFFVVSDIIAHIKKHPH